MIQDGPVGVLCGVLWEQRQRRGAIDAKKMARDLTVACARQVEVMEDYNPECDNRVRWAREVIADAKQGAAVPRASLGLEAAMEFMREPCGKLLAAGGDT